MGPLAPSVMRCRCHCRRCHGHRCAGGVQQWQRVTVVTPGEWQCKTARSGEWAQHFSNASISLLLYPDSGLEHSTSIRLFCSVTVNISSKTENIFILTLFCRTITIVDLEVLLYLGHYE